MDLRYLCVILSVILMENHFYEISYGIIGRKLHPSLYFKRAIEIARLGIRGLLAAILSDPSHTDRVSIGLFQFNLVDENMRNIYCNLRHTLYIV